MGRLHALLSEHLQCQVQPLEDQLTENKVFSKDSADEEGLARPQASMSCFTLRRGFESSCAMRGVPRQTYLLIPRGPERTMRAWRFVAFDAFERNVGGGTYVGAAVHAYKLGLISQEAGGFGAWGGGWMEIPLLTLLAGPLACQHSSRSGPGMAWKVHIISLAEFRFFQILKSSNMRSNVVWRVVMDRCEENARTWFGCGFVICLTHRKRRRHGQARGSRVFRFFFFFFRWGGKRGATGLSWGWPTSALGLWYLWPARMHVG